MNREIKNYPSYLDYPIEQKLPTIGDKIRESNDNLIAFIKWQYGDDRIFDNRDMVYIEDYLNQPYTEGR